jgi:hypothetical protein
VQAFDVAGELLDTVDVATALHLDGHHLALRVAADQVDRADRGGVLAAHEREPVLDRVRRRGEQRLADAPRHRPSAAPDPRRTRALVVADHLEQR